MSFHPASAAELFKIEVVAPNVCRLTVCLNYNLQGNVPASVSFSFTRAVHKYYREVYYSQIERNSKIVDSEIMADMIEQIRGAQVAEEFLTPGQKEIFNNCMELTKEDLKWVEQDEHLGAFSKVFHSPTAGAGRLRRRSIQQSKKSRPFSCSSTRARDRTRRSPRARTRHTSNCMTKKPRQTRGRTTALPWPFSKREFVTKIFYVKCEGTIFVCAESRVDDT